MAAVREEERSGWRALVLANTFIKEQGAKIWSGPFAGMEYVTEATEGSLIARLLDRIPVP